MLCALTCGFCVSLSSFYLSALAPSLVLLINEVTSRKQMEVQWNHNLPLMIVLLVGRLFFSSTSSTARACTLYIYSFESSEFLYTPPAASESTDSVTCSINFSVTSARKNTNSMQKQWNSTAIKHMREQLKPSRTLSSCFISLHKGD